MKVAFKDAREFQDSGFRLPVRYKIIESKLKANTVKTIKNLICYSKKYT